MSRTHSPRWRAPEKVEMFIINKCEGGDGLVITSP